MVLLWCLLGLGLGNARADVSVSLAVSVADGVVTSDAPGTITARLRWLGADRELPLALTAPGLWTATTTGPPVRTLGVELWRMDRRPPLRVSQGLEVMPSTDTTLSWSLSDRREDAAWRLSEPSPFSVMRNKAERGAIVGAAWTFLSVLLVLVLGRHALARSGVLPWVGRHAPLGWAVIGWLCLAVLWTWPAILAGPDIVGRHFDALGTVWVIDAATRLGFDLFDSASAWPAGAHYAAIDSWLLLPISRLGAALDPAALHGFIAIIGVASSGLAASAFAGSLGAHRPFDTVAGVLFVCSGLGAAALLEGHVYQLLNPWMPLMALCLLRAGEGRWRRRYGLTAGLCFGLALFSSGYLGLSAGVLALGLGLPILWRGPRDGVVIAAGVALSFGVLYLFLMVGAGPPGVGHASPETLQMGALSLGSLGSATAEIDRTDHSWALALSAMVMALGVIALAARSRAGVSLALVVLVCVLVALGPEWSVGSATIGSPLRFIWEIPAVRYFRFPGRILWAAMLCLSAGAALGLTVLAAKLGRRVAFLVMLLVVVEVLITVRLPLRQVRMSSDAPQVYARAYGPVFDLVGEGIARSREVDAWMSAMLCQYQTQHGRPIADNCVAVGPENNPRVALGRWVAAGLYAGDVAGVATRLSDLGFTSLAVHHDWIDAGDRLRLGTALKGHNGQTEATKAEGVTVYALKPMKSTPGVQGASMVGPPVTAMDWRLRVDLIGTQIQNVGRLFVVLDGGEPVELKDQARLPGAQPADGIYSAAWVSAVESDVQMHLIQIRAGVRTALWSGLVVPLDIAEDRLTFRMDASGAAQPALRALEMFSPEVRSRSRVIRGMAWLASFVLMALWWIWWVRFARLGGATADGVGRGS